jgi:N-acyl amino acid synthase of PEP-CTERM/exosortase system
MSRSFRALTLDDSPQLLEKSYRLRYQVYCLERKFLAAGDYPEGLERDEFDSDAVHVGVVDSDGELAGTARVIHTGAHGLPILRYCTLFPDERAFDDVSNLVVETSRLSVSRNYTRRHDDGFYGVAEVSDPPAVRIGRPQRSLRGGVFATLLKSLYQATKRLGATHWIAATEKSLQRRLIQFGTPFRLAGPEAVYGGVVAPYIMALAEWDEVILSGKIPAVDDFLVGLEPEFMPRMDQHDRRAALAAIKR